MIKEFYKFIFYFCFFFSETCFFNYRFRLWNVSPLPPATNALVTFLGQNFEFKNNFAEVIYAAILLIHSFIYLQFICFDFQKQNSMLPIVVYVPCKSLYQSKSFYFWPICYFGNGSQSKTFRLPNIN